MSGDIAGAEGDGGPRLTQYSGGLSAGEATAVRDSPLLRSEYNMYIHDDGLHILSVVY